MTMKKMMMTAAAISLMLSMAAGACAQSYCYGDWADEIGIIQEALTELDLYYADITGHYGQKTEKAVRLFQQKYGLAQTGVADEDTLSRLYALVEVKAPAVSRSVQASVSTATVLRRDSTGEAVRKLQEDLHDLGFYKGEITGRYGSLTQEAVRRFQRKHKLDADGVAGPKTLAKLASLMGEAPGGASSSSSSASSGSASAVSAAAGTSAILKHGMKGDAVWTLQENLAALGYYKGMVTGSYGNLTKEAVRLFQRDNKLSADGIAGPKTLAEIQDELADAGVITREEAEAALTDAAQSAAATTVSPSVSLASVSTLNTEWTLRRTSRNGHVTRLQSALAALGYFSDSVTGYFGSVTEEAVKNYQAARGLTVDGIAGRATLTSINSDIKNGVTASGAAGD